MRLFRVLPGSKTPRDSCCLSAALHRPKDSNVAHLSPQKKKKLPKRESWSADESGPLHTVNNLHWN